VNTPLKAQASLWHLSGLSWPYPSYLRQPTVIGWESLRFQFGSAATSKSGKYKFRTDFITHLGQVIRLAYQDAKVDEVPQGLRLRPSPPHVSRGTRPALSLPWT